MVLIITLKRKPSLTDYYLHNQKLTVVSKAKYLGVILDSKLSFNDHIDAPWTYKSELSLVFLEKKSKALQSKGQD